MKLWRICRAKYKTSAFSGQGAEKTGGRWNHKGHAVVYASENLSLAALELFVHVAPESLPGDLISIFGTLPDWVSATKIVEADLPPNWREYPAPAPLQELGTDWIRSQSSLVIIVPSAINARENNLLLNPVHPEMAELTIGDDRPFLFDPRMFGK